MTEKMMTIKIEEAVHKRLSSYRRRLMVKRDAFQTFGDAIDECLNAIEAQEAQE